MFAISQLNFNRTLEDQESGRAHDVQHLTFAISNKEKLTFKYRDSLEHSEHWSFRNYSTFITSGQDNDYSFYLILE